MANMERTIIKSEKFMGISESLDTFPEELIENDVKNREDLIESLNRRFDRVDSVLMDDKVLTSRIQVVHSRNRHYFYTFNTKREKGSEFDVAKLIPKDGTLLSVKMDIVDNQCEIFGIFHSKKHFDIEFKIN